MERERAGGLSYCITIWCTEESYLQLEEVCPAVIVLLVDLQIAAVEMIRKVIPSFTCTESLIGLKEFIKGGL